MICKPLHILLCTLLAVSLLLAFSGCGAAGSDEEPVHTASVPEVEEPVQTASVPEVNEAPEEQPDDEHTHDDDALIDQLTGASYTPDEDDVVLEYSFEELIRQADGLFAFPGVPWDSDFSALTEHFGISAMPYYPETNPELWLSITAGSLEMTAVPYFSDNTALNGTKQCQIMVEDKYFDQSDMQEAFDTLLDIAVGSLGEPVEDVLDSPGEKMLFWRWETESDGGLNRLELYTETDSSTGELTSFGIQLINK